MGDRRDRHDRFRPDELSATEGAGQQAEMLRAARELEWLASTDDVAPTTGFEDRVMAAVAAEPTPRPVLAAVSAARRGAISGVLAAVADIWRVAWTGGRPLGARLPAMAIVLVMLAGTVGAGALGVGTLAHLVDGPPETPSLAPVASPSPSPTASPSPTLSPSPSPSASPAAGESPDESETHGAERTEEPTRPATESPRPTRTPRPTETPDEDETPHGEESPEPMETPHDD